MDAESAWRAVVEAHLGAPDRVQRNGEHDYRCPFCAERGVVHHLHVHYRKGKALCHGCGWKAGSLSYLVQVLSGGASRGLVDAVGDDLVDFIDSVLFGSDASVQKEQAPELPPEYVALSQRRGDRVGQAVWRYLVEDRGVREEWLEAGGVGYGRGGVLHGYAIMPVHVRQQLVTYTSRRVPSVRFNGAKVRHGPWPSRRAIFNYDACVGVQRLFIGEGPFDAWAMHRRLSVEDGGCALLGTNLTRWHVRLIADLAPREVFVCFDPDATEKARVVAERLAGIVSAAHVVVLDGDPDEVDQRAFQRAVAQAQRVEFGLTEPGELS